MSPEFSRTGHINVGLGYIEDRASEGVSLLDGPDGPLSPADTITAVQEQRALGFEVWPACDEHDAKGRCLGHEKRG